MREVTKYIALDEEILIDIDVLDNDTYIGITDKGNVVFPQNNIRINNVFSFPFIRLLDSTSFLIADTRTNELTDNCFVYDLKGNVIKQFYIGDGVQDIEILNDKIIVTYFDEGVYGSDGPNRHGLVILDFNGEILFKYNEKHGNLVIADCYCICKHGASSILFLPYTDFPLISLDLNTFEEQVYETADEVKGSNAITTIDESVIFHSPYSDKRAFYKGKINEKQVKRIGEYAEGLRGLEKGRFLSIGQSGYTIIDMS